MSSAVPIQLEAPRPGNALQAGDLFFTPPPGLAPLCKPLSPAAAAAAKAAGDEKGLAEQIRAAEYQLQRPALNRVLAASRILLKLLATATAQTGEPAAKEPPAADEPPAAEQPPVDGDEPPPAAKQPPVDGDEPPADADAAGGRRKRSK